MILVVLGDNQWQIQREIASQTEAFLKDNDEFGLERVDAEEASLERIKEVLLGQALFSSNKLVIIRQPEANKQLLEELEHIIGSVPDSTDVLFVFSKVDKRAKYYKFLQKNTDVLELNQMDARGLSAWLVSEAKQRSGTLSASNSQLLVDRVGPNQAQLSQELDKLMLFSPDISREMIVEQIDRTPQSTVFELMDAAFGGNKKKALAIYKEQRELKVEPLAILGMIAWQLHVLLIVASSKDRSPAKITKDAKIHPFVVNKSKNIVRSIPYAQLKELVGRALELDIRLKTQSINADDAMQHLLLSI